MKHYLFIVIIFYSISIFAEDFKTFVNTIGYDYIDQSLTAIEKDEFSKITFKENRPLYPDKIFRLYLLSSEINTNDEFNNYLNTFTTYVASVKPKLKGLNKYNQAEKILHLLHDTYFKHEITGSGAGYNIGIKETLDSHNFNCYKSALIYNALLEYFGFESYLVMVPEHIFSVVLIAGKPINVETTNRYGFDPYNQGAPRFKRVLDKANISFSKKSYPKQTAVDNISVISIIYNSRMLLYTGQRSYSGYSTAINHQRAVALATLGLYIHRSSTNLGNNIQFPVYQITSNNMKSDPLHFKDHYLSYKKFINKPLFIKFNKNYSRNISISLMDTLPLFRKEKYGSESSLKQSEISDSFIESLKLIEELSLSKEISSTAWNNYTLDYYAALEKKINLDSLDAIIIFTSELDRFFKSFDSDFAIQHRVNATKLATVHFNNYLLDLVNKKQYQRALTELDRGSSILTDKINFYDKNTMDVVKKNRAFIVNRIKAEQ